MASVLRARDFEESKFTRIVESCLQDFPHVKALRMGQRTSLINLARGKDVFTILLTRFGIFEGEIVFSIKMGLIPTVRDIFAFAVLF